MSRLLIAPLVASLSLDTFAVSAAIGVAPLSQAIRLRFALACMLVETAMPIAGFAIGGLARHFGSAADWLAIVILAAAGLWIVMEAMEGGEDVAAAVGRGSTSLIVLLLGALAIGFDELAAGVALGAFHQPIGLVIGAIAAQAFIASMLGLRVGWALGTRAGTRAGLAAGLVLIGVAIWLAGLHLARISV